MILRSQGDIEEYVSKASLEELEFIYAVFGGPHNALIRRKRNLSDSFLEEINKKIQTMAFEENFLSDSK